MKIMNLTKPDIFLSLHSWLQREWSWIQTIFRFLAGFNTQVSIRHNLSVKISGINARLDEIMKNKENYMTKAADNKDSAMVSWRPSVIMSTNTKM